MKYECKWLNIFCSDFNQMKHNNSFFKNELD